MYDDEGELRSHDHFSLMFPKADARTVQFLASELYATRIQLVRMQRLIDRLYEKLLPEEAMTDERLQLETAEIAARQISHFEAAWIEFPHPPGSDDRSA